MFMRNLLLAQERLRGWRRRYQAEVRPSERRRFRGFGLFFYTFGSCWRQGGGTLMPIALHNERGAGQGQRHG